MHTTGFKRILFFALCFGYLFTCGLFPVRIQSVEAVGSEYSVSAVEPEKPLYPGHQHRFDGIGRVDRISRGEVVIDDRTFKFSKRVHFNAPGRHDVPRVWVREGDIVGFILNARKEVDSIWIME